MDDDDSWQIKRIIIISWICFCCNQESLSQRIFSGKILKTDSCPLCQKTFQRLIYPDINPIANLWSIIKRDGHKNGKRYSINEDLWEAIKN